MREGWGRQAKAIPDAAQHVEALSKPDEHVVIPIGINVESDRSQQHHDLERIGQPPRISSWLAGLRAHRLALALAGVLIVPVAVVYFSGMGRAGEAPASPIDSIAVLPFADDTADTDAEYLNDKISESLINSLSRLPKLRVVPRSVVANYKGKDIDPRKAGRELNVRAVVTGRVRRHGDTISIQADLIDLENVAQIWGQHYDRKLADILIVQDDISRNIFENLRLKLLVDLDRRIEHLLD